MPDDSPIAANGNKDRAPADAQTQLRIRAAWLYYVEGMTQSDVAKKLGVNRVMITRLLADARKRGEVMIQIRSPLASLVDLQHRLETRFGLDQAIVAPFEDADGDPTRVIAAAAGALVTKIMRPDSVVGVGWGRTLNAMLPYIEARPLDRVRVVSLLGGIAEARRFNPAEFAWQFAEHFDADGYLIPAPAIVDSAYTKHALLEQCGLDQILQMAEGCDVALFSCGGITSMTTSYRVGHVTEAERHSMIEAGAVGDVLYNFINADGQRIDHQVNERAIAMPIERLNRVPIKILISGGPEKIEIMRATMKALRPSALVTDEVSAHALLEAKNEEASPEPD